MISSILTAIAIGLGACLILAAGVVVARRSPDTSHQGVDEAFLLNLGQGLGLQEYFDRELFGEHLQVLRGTFEDLEAELEISDGAWEPYVRITIEFPRGLAQDLQVLSDDKGSLVSQLRRLQETEIGYDEFDERFLLFARDEDRLDTVMSSANRYQLLRLDDDVDDLRISDQTLFLLAERGSTRDEVASLLKKALEAADRLYKTAKFLGPRNPQADSSRYEQATFEHAARGKSDEISEQASPNARG